MARLLLVLGEALIRLARKLGAEEDAPALSEEQRLAGVAEEYGLSLREREVLETYLDRRSIKGCAAELYLAPGTVKAHLSHIYDKTRVTGRDQLVMLCETYPRRAA